MRSILASLTVGVFVVTAWTWGGFRTQPEPVKARTVIAHVCPLGTSC